MFLIYCIGVWAGKILSEAWASECFLFTALQLDLFTRIRHNYCLTALGTLVFLVGSHVCELTVTGMS